MGQKGGSSYHERPLSEEEKQLLRQQQAYLASIQPSIDQLVSRGTSLLNDVVNPNWSSIYSQTVNDVDNLRKEQAELATGKLPDAYANAKTNYFNRIYENTMGQQLSAMARKGIVDSSRLNSATNDMQKNIAAQMSKDYSEDLNTQKGCWTKNINLHSILWNWLTRQICTHLQILNNIYNWLKVKTNQTQTLFRQLVS